MGKKHVKPRNVAVAIPYRVNASAVEICLVTSRKHDGLWVLPKGGVEVEERGENETQAAVREMWEEAGLRPSAAPNARLHQQGTPVADHKPHKRSPVQSDPKSPAFIPRAIYTAIEIEIAPDAEADGDWPEEHERQRKWFPLQEAKERVQWRPDIAMLLKAATFGGHQAA